MTLPEAEERIKELEKIIENLKANYGRTLTHYLDKYNELLKVIKERES